MAPREKAATRELVRKCKANTGVKGVLGPEKGHNPTVTVLTCSLCCLQPVELSATPVCSCQNSGVMFHLACQQLRHEPRWGSWVCSGCTKAMHWTQTVAWLPHQPLPFGLQGRELGLVCRYNPPHPVGGGLFCSSPCVPFDGTWGGSAGLCCVLRMSRPHFLPFCELNLAFFAPTPPPL